MFLIFLNEKAEIVTPTKEAFKKVYNFLDAKHSFKILALPDDLLHLEVHNFLDNMLLCSYGSNVVDNYVPIGSKTFFKRVLRANSLMVNGLAVKAGEDFSAQSCSSAVFAVLCNEQEYIKIDSKSSREFYPFNGAKYLTTINGLGAKNGNQPN